VTFSMLTVGSTSIIPSTCVRHHFPSKQVPYLAVNMLQPQADLYKLEEHSILVQELPVLVFEEQVQVTLLRRGVGDNFLMLTDATQSIRTPQSRQVERIQIFQYMNALSCTTIMPPSPFLDPARRPDLRPSLSNWNAIRPLKGQIVVRGWEVLTSQYSITICSLPLFSSMNVSKYLTMLG
jgi:hypothetical protein